MSRRSIRARRCRRRALSRPAAARYFTSFYFIYTQPAYLVDVVITLRRVVRRICRAALLSHYISIITPARTVISIYSDGHMHTAAHVSLALFMSWATAQKVYKVDSRDFSSLASLEQQAF
jgi:hypothetical protein